MTLTLKRWVFAIALLLALIGAGSFLSSSRGYALDQKPTIRVAKDQSRARRLRASFPHNKPKHKTLECSKCHQVTAAKPSVTKFPGHNVCIECHNFAEAAVNDFSGYCGVCHSDVPASKDEAKLYPFPKRAGASDFGVAFSHPSHLKPFARPASPSATEMIPVSFVSASAGQSGEMVTPKCTDCHKAVQRVSAGAPEKTLGAGHPACFTCHGAAAVKPPSMNQCAECHKLGQADAPQLFGAVKGFKHLDHEIDIRRRKKGQPLIVGEALCIVCHSAASSAAKLSDIKKPAASTCRECHNGGIGYPDKLAASVEASLK